MTIDGDPDRRRHRRVRRAARARGAVGRHAVQRWQIRGPAGAVTRPVVRQIICRADESGSARGARRQGVTTSLQAPAPTPDGARRAPRRSPRPLAALAGLLAAAVALGVAELVAGAGRSGVLPGHRRRRRRHHADARAGQGLRHPHVRRERQDRPGRRHAGGHRALRAARGPGRAAQPPARRRSASRSSALVGVVAAVTRPAGGPLDGLPSLVGAAAGIVALLALLRRSPPARGRRAGRGPSAGRRDAAPTSGSSTGCARCSAPATARAPASTAAGFFLTSGVAARRRRRHRRRGPAAAAPVRRRRRPGRPSPCRAGVPRRGAARRRRPGRATIDGLTPLFTANRDFYRVDTAITVPQIRPADYRLALTGMFDSPRTYTLADLFERDDVIERDITLTCVSNEVGGGLAGTARWIGVPLGALLRENGIRSGQRPAALPLRGRHDDRRPDPRRARRRGRDAGLRDERRAAARSSTASRCGCSSPASTATCRPASGWSGIEATTFDAFDAYWTERDWAAEGPIKIASRIDTPAPLRQFPAGRRAIAGVAWAQTRGIAAGRGPGRRRGLGRGRALPRGRRRPVAPVGAALRLRARPALAHRPRHRRRRRGADRGARRRPSPPAPAAGTPSR